MQFPGHRHGQRTLTIEHLVNAIGPANVGHEVIDREIALLHYKPDRLDRVRQIEWKVFRLVGLYERGQDVKTIALGRAGFRLHQPLYGSQGCSIVPLVSDRLDFHFQLDASDCLGVNTIILGVRSDKSDVNNAVRIVDPSYDPVLISRKVEDHTTVLQNAGIANVTLDICRRRPVSFTHLLKPGQSRLSSIDKFRFAIEARLQCSQSDHHTRIS